MSHVPSNGVPAPRHWWSGGKQYPVSRLSQKAWAEVRTYLAETIPNPRDEARKLMEGLPADVARIIWDDMVIETVPHVIHDGKEWVAAKGEDGQPVMVRRCKPWPPAMNTPETTAALMTAECQAILIYHAVRKNVAGFGRDEARAVADDTSDEEYAALLTMVFGEDGDPKGDEAAATRKTKRTGR